MKKRIILTVLSSLLVVAYVFGNSDENVKFHKGIDFEIFNKMSMKTRDFSKKPDLEGKISSLTLAISPYEENYTVRYKGKFDVQETGKYKIPMCMNNIASVQSNNGEIVKKDFKNGKVWFSGNTKDISIRLKR